MAILLGHAKHFPVRLLNVEPPGEIWYCGHRIQDEDCYDLCYGLDCPGIRECDCEQADNPDSRQV